MPAGTNQLALSGSTIVLGTATSLHVLEALGGHVRLLAPVKRPIGVSIEARRIAWAENISGTRARIRVLELG